jgi:hypothetical protein
MHPPFRDRLKEKAKRKRVWIIVLVFYTVVFGATEHRFFGWVNEQFDKYHGGFVHLMLFLVTHFLVWVKGNPLLFVTTTGLLFCLSIILTAFFGREKVVPVTALHPFHIIKAVWGIPGQWAEVTGIVQGIISTGTTTIRASIEVFGDPLYGHHKMLLITYTIGTGAITVRIQEGQTCDLPIRGRAIFPPQHTPIMSPNPDQLLEVSVSRRKTVPRDDGRSDWYSCEVSVKNMSTVVLQNVGVKLTSWSPVPSDPHTGTTDGTIDKQTQTPLPMPVDFPIDIKPESQTGRTINRGDSSTFLLFKMIRAGGSATVEIVGAERQYHWFHPPKLCTVKLDCSSSVGVLHRQYQITFERDEKSVASFTVV